MRNTVFILVFTVMLYVPLFANGGQEIVAQEDSDGYMSVTSDDMQVKWKVEGDQIDFEINAPTTGWVSVGFDPSRIMKDANFIFGYVDGGTVVVKDQFGTGTFSHKADEELGGTDDIISYSGREENGKTILRFSLPIDSGDDFDTVLSPGEVHTVLIAYGPDGADNFTKKHSMRLKVDLTL